MRIRYEQLASSSTLAVHDGQRFVPLRSALALGRGDFPSLNSCIDDLVAFLAGGERTRDEARKLCELVSGEAFEGGTPGLPYQPRSLRGFSSFEEHWISAARAMAKRYHPVARHVVPPIELATGRPFPPFRPRAEFYKHPVYYQGNHLTVMADGETIPWPHYCKDLDYELELAAIVVRSVQDATLQQAREAIGGFVVFNDVSARDVQWEEFKGGMFGPVIKTKSFASMMGAEVVTADEVLDKQDALAGRVLVNGECWAQTSTAGMKYSFEAMLAWASRGERVLPGELLASGTLPRGSGMEIERWISAGDHLRLEVDGVGSVSNQVGERGPKPKATPS